MLIVTGPWLSAQVRRGAAGIGRMGAVDGGRSPGDRVYGGYRAGQGILLLAVLGLALTDSIQRVNALKNVLATLTKQSRPSSSRSLPTWTGESRC